MFLTSKLITVLIRKGNPNQMLIYSMDKQSSRMQEQFYFSESSEAGNCFQSGFFFFFFFLQLGVARRCQITGPSSYPPSPTSSLGEV